MVASPMALSLTSSCTPHDGGVSVLHFLRLGILAAHAICYLIPVSGWTQMITLIL